ncbi:MAG: DUF2510 domain-containing protein [Salinibacterium sp.]|nr:DUF2510 domain-containing protein [Salinibacterium sp.]
MFEDDVTVPAGWYPDPMGLPQLRWWNNHAWTELTTEARPPLVMQTPTRLAYPDDELPTRRQQREQRERDEQYTTLATDEDEARDAAAAHAPLTVTLREIDAPASAESDRLPVHEPSGASVPAPSLLDRGEDAFMHDFADLDNLDDDAVDAGDRDHVSANFGMFDYDRVAAEAGQPEISLPRPAFVPTVGSVLGSPVTSAQGAEGIVPAHSPDYSSSTDSLFQPRSATSTVEDRRARDLRREAEPLPRLRSLPRLPIYTAPVWLIALVPLLLLVLSLLLLLGFGSSLNLWVTPGIALSSYIFVVMLAIADRATLGRAGYEHRASWAWALLTAPVYLVARSMSLAKVGPLGFAPVLVWAALAILQVGSVLMVPGLIISALPNVFTMQAEQSTASDASIIGADISVNCSKNLPVIIGQEFTCAATSSRNDPFNITVSLQRTNGWINWHVDDWGIYTLSR